MTIRRELETVVHLEMSEDDLNSIVNLLTDYKDEINQTAGRGFTSEYMKRMTDALNGLRGLTT